VEKSNEDKCHSESETQWVLVLKGEINDNPYYANTIYTEAEDDCCRLVQRLTHNPELYTPEGRIETAKKNNLKPVKVNST
jgi:hypothetical protein